MKEKIKTYLSLWTIKRFLQLLFGLYFFWEYAKHPNLLALVFGLLMTFQAIMNVGCFSSKGCSTPNTGNKVKYDENQEVDYEEVK